MFGHGAFYHSLTKKYVVLVGTLFNEIYIKRHDSTGETTHLIKVPIQYSPRDKMLARLKQDPTGNRDTAITLPRIGFEMTSLNYDAQRKVTSHSFYAQKSVGFPNNFKHQYVGVPYNLNFQINIMCRYTEDGTRIIEQILPMFQPNWNLTAQLIDDYDKLFDIPIELAGVSPTDLYEDDFINRRLVMWTLDLTVRGWYMGPITQKPLIKFTTVSTYAGMNIANSSYTDVPAVQYTMQPGLLANGNSTTNATASIDYNLINIDDDFGYAIVNTLGYTTT